MRINLLQLGTQGVDMKTNPLLLTNQKLRAATNLAFDEGVIRTRPGFRYESWGATGQFQGAGEFRPRVGISSNTLSILQGGVVVVADGEVWLGCDQIGDGFFCKGDVNVFQAENYLILQCKETSTFWWSGLGGLQESPGMNEQDWNDPEMPLQELELQAPVADIPVCNEQGGVTVNFLVIDAATENPVPNVSWTVSRNGVRAHYGVSSANGRFSFNPVPRDYTYSLVVDGYTPIQNIPITVTGETVEFNYEECAPPFVSLIGTTDVIVRMSSQLAPFNIHGFLSVPLGSYDLSEFFATEIVPPGNAHKTAWRLRTDACGYDIIYYVGELNDEGQLLTTGVDSGGTGYFDLITKSLVSGYTYPEGMYLQLGVIINAVMTWSDPTPCIAGGDETTV